MTTDVKPGWHTHTRIKHNTDHGNDYNHANQNPLPGVTFISDLLKVIDSKRQTGYTDDDLPQPFDVPKSYAHVPHQYLAADGFPKSEFWLHSECQSATPAKEGQKNGKGTLSQTALNRYRDQGVEGLPERFQRPVKTYNKTGPRHAKRSSVLNAARCEDQSPEQQSENTYNRSCDRLNDPVLPFENYDRTMEIISHLYTIVDHGKGQFVDRKSKKLIFTYAFEDLESITPEAREEHQKDVTTILMSTKLFRRLPTPRESPPPTSSVAPVSETPFHSAQAINSAGVASPDLSPDQSSQNGAHNSDTPHMQRSVAVGSSTVPPPSNCATSLPPSSPLTPLPQSDYECTMDLDNAIPYQSFNEASVDNSNPPSSPLTSLPSSDAEDFPWDNKQSVFRLCKTIPKTVSVLPKVSKKRKRADMTHMDIQIRNKKRNVTTNAALINGKMYCFGQTVGYSSDILLSPYIPYKGSSESLYLAFLNRLPELGHRIGTRFKSFCKEGFRVARQLLIDLKAPPMASTSKEQTPGPDDFSASFAFTFNNFYNKPHTDNDKGKVYCLWYPIDSKSGKIVTLTEGFVLEGGWFIFPEFRVAIDFGNQSAVQISWNGKTTFHHTLPSKEKDEIKNGNQVHYTRLGCSSQIAYKIAVAACKAGTDEQFNYTSNCERVVRDVKDILALEDRNWKS